MSGSGSAVADLLALLNEKWLPVDRKEAIKRILVNMIDRMDDGSNMDDMR